MSKSNDEYAGSAGLSGAGVGGAVPVCAGRPAVAVLHANADISVQQAMQRALSSGAASAASLAARKPGQIGAPVAAVPAPVAARAPAAAPVQAVGAHRGGGVVTYSNENKTVVALVERVIRFSMSMTGTLAAMQADSSKAVFKFRVPIPENTRSHRAVLKTVKVLRASSTSRQELGVYFGDLKERFMQSMSDGSEGAPFHTALPRNDQPACTKKDTVYELDGMFNARHIAMYGEHTSVDDLMAQLEVNEKTQQASVWMDSAIGAVIMSNNVFGKAPVHEVDGKRFFNIGLADARSIAQQIYDQIISDRTFKKTLTDLQNFDVRLVPLNASGVFTDVPELNVEPSEVVTTELNRGFSVNLLCEMTVLMVPRLDDAGAACARP